MIRKKGFDTSRYLSAQVKSIVERVNKYDKLYLEFGGKLRYDQHASRCYQDSMLTPKFRCLKGWVETLKSFTVLARKILKVGKFVEISG